LEVGSKIDIEAPNKKKPTKEEDDGYLVKIVEEAKQEAELKQGELARKVLEETGKKKSSGSLKKINFSENEDKSKDKSKKKDGTLRDKNKKSGSILTLRKKIEQIILDQDDELVKFSPPSSPKKFEEIKSPKDIKKKEDIEAKLLEGIVTDDLSKGTLKLKRVEIIDKTEIIPKSEDKKEIDKKEEKPEKKNEEKPEEKKEEIVKFKKNRYSTNRTSHRKRS